MSRRGRERGSERGRKGEGMNRREIRLFFIINKTRRDRPRGLLKSKSKVAMMIGVQKNIFLLAVDDVVNGEFSNTNLLPDD